MFILLSRTTRLSQMKVPVFSYLMFLTLPECPFHLLQPDTLPLYKSLCHESDFTCQPHTSLVGGRGGVAAENNLKQESSFYFFFTQKEEQMGQCVLMSIASLFPVWHFQAEACTKKSISLYRSKVIQKKYMGIKCFILSVEYLQA